MDKLVKNSIHRAVTESYASDGSGVVRIGGRAVFVRGAIPGETWDVRIVKATSAAVWGRAETLILPSSERVTPICPHFGKCGGCDTMHMSYGEELRFKLGRVNDAIAHIGRLDFKVDGILGAEETSGYRDKAVYAVGEADGRTITGFYRPRSHDIIDIERCFIQPEASDRAASALRRFMDENGLPAYDEETKTGCVRRIFTRLGAKSAELQCAVVCAYDPGDSVMGRLSDALKSACPELRSFVLFVDDSEGNTVLKGKQRTIYGSDAISDELCNLRFELSPLSFYQINPVQAERLYRIVSDCAALSGGLALDLYCGAGTIALHLSRYADKVIGAEIVPEAVLNARENARRNGITNAEFMLGDAAEAAKTLLGRGTRPDVVVVDPPRKGLSPSVIESIAGMAPDRVVYVSCDPGTLARDLAVFAERGYAPVKGVAVDMFPRTRHVECVVLMSRTND